MSRLPPLRSAQNSRRPGQSPTGLVVALTALLLTGCSSIEMETRSASLQPTARGSTEAEEYVRGRQHLAAGRFGLALSEFRRALQRDPGSVPTLNAIGVSYDLLGRPDLAQAHFERALAHQPQSPQTLNNLGRSLLRQGRLELALSYLERAGELGENDPVIQANLELARRLSASKAGVDHEPAGPERPVVWVERSTSLMQTLVTSRPEAGPRVNPAVVHVAAAEAEPSLGRTAAREIILEVSNGAGRRHMAARFRSFLATRGLGAARLTNAAHFRFEHSVIFYRPGFEAAARQLASLLPPGVAIESVNNQPADVRLRLGADLLGFDTNLLPQDVVS